MLTPEQLRSIYSSVVGEKIVPADLVDTLKRAMVETARAQKRLDVEIALAQRARRSPTFVCCGNCAKWVADQITTGELPK